MIKSKITQCAFCDHQGIEAKSGKTVCPECDAAFEIDDRGECIFVDPSNPRLPIEGIICPRCGLVQGENLSVVFFVGQQN